MAHRSHPKLTAGKSIEAILSVLREIHRVEAFAALSYLAATQSAPWQIGVTNSAGDWIFGVAVMPDGIEGRGWLVAYASDQLTKASQLRCIGREFRLMQRLGPWHQLRAWIPDGDTIEEEFAKWAGLRLDCGPASGLSPSGRNMNLWLWER
jgi:hypothetical protein